MPINNKLVVAKPAAIGTGAEVAPLHAKAGPVRRIGVSWATSKAAGKALREVENFRVQRQADIAKTAIELSAVRIGTALVASTMPGIGALAVSLNNATAGVDMALTNGVAAEVACHIENRHRNLVLADELHAVGKLNDDEQAVLRNFAETDAATDVERSRNRMTEAKAAVQTLHGYALASIEKARSSLDQ